MITEQESILSMEWNETRRVIDEFANLLNMRRSESGSVTDEDLCMAARRAMSYYIIDRLSRAVPRFPKLKSSAYAAELTDCFNEALTMMGDSKLKASVADKLRHLNSLYPTDFPFDKAFDFPTHDANQAVQAQ